MSEAKDWAGELISGQTGTGRILVSSVSNNLTNIQTHLDKHTNKKKNQNYYWAWELSLGKHEEFW